MEAPTRIFDRGLLLQAGRGTARLVLARVTASPRIALGAAVVALVIGIGGNALLFQAGRHPAPLFAAPPQTSAAAVEPVAAPFAPPPAPTPAATSVAAHQAPATTASIGPATQADRPRASPPARAANRAEKHTAAHQPDSIGAFLRGVNGDDGSHLTRAAQAALAKLGYLVKPGTDDEATRRALRQFQHTHGLPETAEISPELVKRLTDAAAKAER